MCYQQKLDSARGILEAHNEKLKDSTAKIDIDQFFSKLEVMGGTTAEALAEATWEDIQDCGIPRILSRKIAVEWRVKLEEAVAQKIVVQPSNPVDQALSMTHKELIQKYDPMDSKNPFGERLRELSEGKRFLVFQQGEKLVDLSLKLFLELEDYGEKTEVLVDGIPQRVYKVGDRPGRTADEHPLYPGIALRPGGISKKEINWSDVPLESRQILWIAVVKTKELDPSQYDEIDLHDIAARGLESLSQRYRKAAVRYQELKELGKLPALKVSLGNGDSSSKKNQPFLGTNRQT